MIFALEARQITEAVREFGQNIFTALNMTPIDFRRYIPTEIFRKNLIESNGNNTVDVLKKYANLVCTSFNVKKLSFKLTNI